jgi:hypothetical protein
VTLDLEEITDRPTMNVEMASNSIGGDKAAWITEGYRAVYAGLPSIAAIVWLNADLRGLDQPDWRIANPPAALQAYRDIVSWPEFQGRFKKRSRGTIADALGG